MKKKLFTVRETKSVSLEEQSTGVTQIEDEYCFYIKVDNFDFLNGLKYEDQVQYQTHFENSIKGGKGLAFRIRRTILEGSIEYVQTLKSKSLGVNSRLETSFPVTRDVFEQVAEFVGKDKAMAKRRFFSKNIYEGEIEDACFEYDVFAKEDGTYHNWIKVDFEIPSKEGLDKITLTSLFREEVIINKLKEQTKCVEFLNSADKSGQTQDVISGLYTTIFTNGKAL